MRKKKTEHYSAENITSLTDVEHLKKKINLTFGRETGDEENPYSLQKTVAIRELTDNSCGEIIRNFADRLEVTFHNDGFITVLDNGRGLPIDSAINADGEEVNGFILTLGTLRSGENLGNNSSGGKSTSQNGLGASAACALSERVDIEVYRNGKIYYMSFNEFVAGYFEDDEFKPLKNKSKLKSRKDDRDEYYKTNFPTGTKIRIKLDDNIFSSPYPVNVDDLNDRLKSASYLLPKSHIKVIDEFKNNETYEYYSENGLKDALPAGTEVIEFSTSNEYLEKNVPISENGVITHKDLIRTVEIELAFNYAEESKIDTYVNTIKTRLKGVHLQAFEDAIVEAFNSVIKGKEKPSAVDYLDGINLQLSTFISDPLFSGQTKEELAGKEVKAAIQDAVKTELLKYIHTKSNKENVDTITKRAITLMQARQRIQENKKLAKEKLNAEIGGMKNRIENYVDCRSKDVNKRELYVCLKGDTKVKLLNGNDVCIQDLVGKKDLWAYSIFDNLHMRPAKIKEVFETQRVKELLKLTFNDGSVIECTENHLFMDRQTLKWVKAGKIAIGQSLASMKFKEDKDRLFVWLPKDPLIKYQKNHWEAVHKRVAGLLGISKPYDGKTKMDIHHKDFNKHNNEPDNLDFIQAKEHLAIHNAYNHANGRMKYENKNFTEESRKRMQNAYLNWSEDGKERIRQGTIKSWEKDRHNPNRTWKRYINSDKFKDDIKKLAELTKTRKLNENLKLAKQILEEHAKLTEDLWNSHRQRFNYQWGTLLNKFNNNIDEVVEHAKNYNLTCVKIEKVLYEDEIPVYCLNIDCDTHAFVLGNGLITHNCEGLSALSSLKQARNAEYQALMPIRGKIKSTYKVKSDEALSSQLIKNIIKLVGTGVNTKTTKCDISKLKFNKIIFACDADEDACFSGDTKIKLLNGATYTFEELVDNNMNDIWVYSKDENGKIVPAKAIFPRITKYVNELVELEFENGFKVKCTPEHKFLLNSNVYKKAKDLKNTDLLSSIYFRKARAWAQYNDELQKIKSLKTIKLGKPIPVYDITVPDYNNFLISTSEDDMDGVIVHNCHIQSLLLTLFYTFMPELIENGNVYSLQTPLFEIFYKDGTKVYAFNEKEKNDLIKDKEVKKIMRNKGLGEISAEDMAIFLNEKTQRLIKYTMNDLEHAKEYMDLFMGSDSEVRKEFISEHFSEYELEE